MAYKMKNPGLAKMCRAAAAGSPAKYSSPIKNRDKVQSDYAAMVNDDSEHGGLSKKQIRQAERAEKKQLRKQNKEQAKELKRFGGDQEKLDAYKDRKAQREAEKEDYRYEKRESLARLGKGYNVKDEDGNYVSVSPKEHRHSQIDKNKDGVVSAQERKDRILVDNYGNMADGGNVYDEKLVNKGSLTRDQVKAREAYDKMTPEQQEAYKQSQLDKLKNMRKSNVEGGDSPVTLKRPDRKERKLIKHKTKTQHRVHERNLKKAKKVAKQDAKQEYKQAKKEIKSYTDY